MWADGLGATVIESTKLLTAKEIARAIGGLFSIPCVMKMDTYSLIDRCSGIRCNRAQELHSGPYILQLV